MIIHIYTFLLIGTLTIIEKRNKYNIIFFLIVLSILDALRYKTYFDYNSYEQHYYFGTGQEVFEIAYNFFVMFCRLFNSYNLFLFVVAVLMYYYIFYKMYKLFNYSNFLVFIMFVQIIPYIGVNRQILSMVIFSIGIINFLIKDKIFKYIICIIISSLFHISSLIGIPIGILYYYKKEYIIKNLLNITLKIILFVNFFKLILNEIMLKNILNILNLNFLTKYTIYFGSNSQYKIELLANIIKTLHIFFPVFFLYFVRKFKGYKNDKKYEELLGLFYIGAVSYYMIYIIFYGKLQVLVGRMSLTLLGLFLPGYYICVYKLIKKKENKLFFKVLTICILGIIFLKTILFSEESYQYIYRTIFN